MSEKQNEQAHKDYIKSKGEFVVNCSHKIFDREEIELLQKYGHWFEALINGSLKPISKEQEDFLLQVKERKQKTKYSKAWIKYKGRIKLEKENPAALNIDYTYVHDPFYSREDYYKSHPEKRRR